MHSVSSDTSVSLTPFLHSSSVNVSVSSCCSSFENSPLKKLTTFSTTSLQNSFMPSITSVTSNSPIHAILFCFLYGIFQYHNIFLHNKSSLFFSCIIPQLMKHSIWIPIICQLFSFQIHAKFYMHIHCSISSHIIHNSFFLFPYY